MGTTASPVRAGLFEVRLHGRGGQGVVTAAELLSEAAFAEGRHAQAFPSFGSERTGAPVLTDSLAWLECELAEAHEAGDHSVFIGRVLGSGRGGGAAGLLFFEGAYGHVDTTERRR